MIRHRCKCVALPFTVSVPLYNIYYAKIQKPRANRASGKKKNNQQIGTGPLRTKSPSSLSVVAISLNNVSCNLLVDAATSGVCDCRRIKRIAVSA
jgi:hypothetical protein